MPVFYLRSIHVWQGLFGARSRRLPSLTICSSFLQIHYHCHDCVPTASEVIYQIHLLLYRIPGLVTFPQYFYLRSVEYNI